MDEQQFLTPKDLLGYAEEYLFDETFKELQNFSLSNSLDDIKNAIYARTGLYVELDDAHWQLCTDTPTSVKNLMNKHRVTYSMTIWYNEEEKCRYFFVTMRVGDKWFITVFFEDNGKVLDFNEYLFYVKLMKHLRKDNCLKNMTPNLDINEVKHIMHDI